MQRIFLSYTFAPHPAHAACLNLLELQLRRVIEALELRVVDGRHLGGAEPETEIRRRIDECDALVAIFTPQANADGTIDAPQYVASEFAYARATRKPAFRVQETSLPRPRGLDADTEHILYSPENLLDVVMKVLQTVAIWKTTRGRAVQIRIQPEDLAQHFDENGKDLCEYQLLLAGQPKASDPKRTTLLPEPGAAYVHVPDFVEGAKVRIRLEVQGDQWRSDFVQPHMGGVALTRYGDRS